MLNFILCGFLIGFLVPVISGRFGKVLPADPGSVLLTLIHYPHFPKTLNMTRRNLLKKKWIKLGGVSLTWGITLSLLFASCFFCFPQSIQFWACLLITILAFCTVIDDMYYLLPDFFTIPLLIGGFSFATITGALSPMDSIIGATFGYLLSTISVFLMGLFRRSEFGYGDVKLIAAVGAWLGAQGLNYALLLSFFVFAIPALIGHRNSGAYGPALGIGTLITFFYIFC